MNFWKSWKENKRNKKIETELYRAKRAENNDWVYGPYAFYASNKGLKRVIYTGTDLGCVIPVEVVPDTVCRCAGIRDTDDENIIEFFRYDIKLRALVMSQLARDVSIDIQLLLHENESKQKQLDEQNNKE